MKTSTHGDNKIFWQTPWQQWSESQWESLCDGCGLCCLHKLEDEDSGEIYYTMIACDLLDLDTCRCRHYEQRHQYIKNCVEIKSHMGDTAVLPPTCGYRLVAEGKPLPAWHHLICGDRDRVRDEGISACSFAQQGDFPLQSHIITLPRE